MKKIIIFLATVLLATSCADMDVPPKNVVTSDQLLSDESGMEIYMARMYSYMPFEDFKYMAQWGFNFNGWLVSLGIEGTGENLDRARSRFSPVPSIPKLTNQPLKLNPHCAMYLKSSKGI